MYNLYSQETGELEAVCYTLAAAMITQEQWRKSPQKPNVMYYEEPTYSLDEVEDYG